MKNIIKILIRLLFSIIYFIPYSLYSFGNPKPIFRTQNKRFIGYFNRNVISKNNLLTCKYNSLSDNNCSILTFDILSFEEEERVQTRYFNLQTGANAQFWNGNILYNDLCATNQIVTKICSPENKIKTIAKGIFGDISKTLGNVIIYSCAAPNFYSSDYCPNRKVNRPLFSKLQVITLQNGSSADVEIDDDTYDTYFYQNFLWNSDGDTFCGIKRADNYEELIFWKFSDDLNKWEIQHRHRGQFISHFCWLDSTKLLCFLKTLENGKKSYHTLTLNGKKSLSICEINAYRDGHPVMLSGRIITDTYPGFSSIIRIYELVLDKLAVSKRSNTILSVYHPFWLVGRKRCDVHLNVHPSHSRNIIIVQRSGLFGRFVEGFNIGK